MASISISGGEHSVGVGQRGAIPFEVANLGKTAEDFLLETNAPPEYEAMLELDGLSDERLSRVAIGTAAPIKGKIMFLCICYMDGNDKCFIQACSGGFDFSFFILRRLA